jgi:hypothetical protein
MIDRSALDAADVTKRHRPAARQRVAPHSPCSYACKRRSKSTAPVGSAQNCGTPSAN